MSVADLEAALEKAKAKHKADKSDKKAKKAYKAAKVALAEAKAAPASKKRPAEETNEQPAKKKVKTNPSVDDLQNAADAAKVAYKANKADKSLKTAWKDAKKALSEAKEAVVDVDALKAALKEAKKVYKDDKSNKENKAAFKAAKAALAEAEAKESEQGSVSKPEPVADDTMDVLASLKKKPEPVADVSALSGLKRGGQTPGLSSARPDDSENAPSKRLFLGNLSYDVDDEKAKEFFKDCGTLVDIFWMTDRETGDFRGIGIVEFETQEQADKACAKNGVQFMGRDLRINYARPRPGGGGRGGGGNKRRGKGPGEKPEGCDTIFLGNISDDVEDDKVYELFKDCGAINRIHWLTDKETGDFKGCGFVEFADPDKALPIAVGFHGAEFCGKTLNVDYSKPRPPKQY